MCVTKRPHSRDPNCFFFASEYINKIFCCKVGMVEENASGNLNWNRSKFPNRVPLQQQLGDEDHKPKSWFKAKNLQISKCPKIFRLFIAYQWWAFKPFESPSYRWFWVVLPVKRKGQISCMVETSTSTKTLHKTMKIEKRNFPVFVYFLCALCVISHNLDPQRASQISLNVISC